MRNVTQYRRGTARRAMSVESCHLLHTVTKNQIWNDSTEQCLRDVATYSPFTQNLKVGHVTLTTPIRGIIPRLTVIDTAYVYTKFDDSSYSR